MCLNYGITPYYPKPSHAEDVNENLKVALQVYHAKNQTSCDTNIPWFQLVFNMATLKSTG